MARDYAKKKTTRKKPGASRSKKKVKKPLGLIVFAILLVSGLIAFLIYLKSHQAVADQNNPVKKQPIATKNQPTKTKPAVSKSSEAKSSDPKSSDPNSSDQNSANKKTNEDEVPFYRTHQEMMNKTVEIPIEDLRLVEDSHQYSYSMPCGSFRDKTRAEELKAQIAFVGYESKVLPVKT